MITTAAPIAREALEAQKLATTIETISEDLHAPVEVDPRFDRQTGKLKSFRIGNLVPDANCPPGETPAATARAIAAHLETWSTRFATIAAAIRERYPAD